jgi:Tol biopolymer transport system component
MSPRIIAGICILGLAAAVVPLVRHWREQPPPPPPMVRLGLSAPPETELGSGDDVLDAAISPDGQEIVLVATTNGMTQLWRRSLDSEAAELLKGTEGASLPAWKTTGRVISFFAGGKLKQLSRADGSIRDLADAPSPAGATWLADGSLLFAEGGRNPIRRMLSGRVSDATTLNPGDQRHSFPTNAGDLGFLYVATLESGRQSVRLVSGGMERELTTATSHAQLVDHTLLLVRDNSLIAQPLDADTLQLTGRSTVLASSVGVSASGHGFFAASPRLLAWASAASRGRQLAWIDLASGRRTPLGEPADIWQARLSPDDRTAAVTFLDPLLRTLDVSLVTLDASAVARRLTRALAADTDPVWSEDGDIVIYRSLQSGRPDLFGRSIDEDNTSEETIMRSELDETASDWRDDLILFHAPSAGAMDLWTYEESNRSVTALTRGGFNEFDGRWSPGMDMLAYVSDESGRPDVYVEPWPRTGERVRVSFAGGSRPGWSANGRALFFLRDGRLMRADFRATSADDDAPFAFSTPVQAIEAGSLRDYAPAHNSNRVLVVEPVARTATPNAGVIVDWMR